MSCKNLDTELEELRQLHRSCTRKRTKQLLEEEITRCLEQLTVTSADKQSEPPATPVDKSRTSPVEARDTERGAAQQQASAAAQNSAAIGGSEAGNVAEPVAAIPRADKLLEHDKARVATEEVASVPLHLSRVANEAAQIHYSPTTLRCYSWDQSNKYVKVYVSVPGLQTSGKGSVSCLFTEDTLTLDVRELNEKNFRFSITNLANKITPDKCTYEVKQDKVLALISKAVSRKHWLALTALEADQLSKKNKLEEFAKLEKQKHIECEKHLKKSHDEAEKKKKKMEREAAKKLHSAQDKTPSPYPAVQPTKLAGWWTVTERSEAREAVQGFLTWPPKAIRIAIQPHDSQAVEFNTLLSVVSARKCGVLCRFLDTFWLQEESYDKDARRLKMLTKSPCFLLEFWGHLSKKDAALLPTSVSILGFAVQTLYDYHTLINLKPRDLQLLNLLIGPGVNPEELVQLPAWFMSVSLHFYGIRDEDAEWMMMVVSKVMGFRRCWLRLPNSLMTLPGARILARRLVNFGVWGVTQESPFVPREARPQLEQLYMKAGCQFRWIIDSVYGEDDEDD